MRVILLGLFFTVTSSQAAWLHRCPAAPQGAPDAFVIDADGKRQRITVSAAKPAGCASLMLPVAADAVAVIRPISSSTAAGIGETVVLQGSDDAGRFVISGVNNGAEAGTPGRSPMPLRANLLSGLTLRAFGIEERVQARIADGRLTLQCGAGAKPAGVVLSAPWHMPQANVELQLSGGGSGRFELLAADAAGAARESASPLGVFTAAAASQAASYALPRAGFERGAWRSFSIACPEQAARLELDGMRLLPSATSIPPRSAWIWNASRWQAQPEDVFAHAEKYGIKTLFISVPQADGAVRDPLALAAFVRGAAQRGMEIWAVDGDPHMVLPGEHAKTAARMRAYAAYNASVEAAARLRGAQFDIEPYLLPGYDLAQKEWDQRYLELARALHDASAGLPLELVVPFWWAGKTELLNAAAPFVSGLSVMDYRTDPNEILRFATPFLDWGDTHRKQVRIALEAGPVEAEGQRRYAKSSSGELWLVDFEQAHFAILLKEPRRNPNGPAFRLAATWSSDVAATSFHRNPGRLLELLPGLEQDFAAWNAFRGIALHELR